MINVQIDVADTTIEFKAGQYSLHECLKKFLCDELIKDVPVLSPAQARTIHDWLDLCDTTVRYLKIETADLTIVLTTEKA